MTYRYNSCDTRIERNVTTPRPLAQKRDRRVTPMRRADNGRNARHEFNVAFRLGHHRGFTNGIIVGLFAGLASAYAIFYMTTF